MTVAYRPYGGLMNRHHLTLTLVVTLLVSLTRGVPCSTAQADEITWQPSGVTQRGEVIRNEPSETVIWFRWRKSEPGSPWQTSAIRRMSVSIRVEPGDQSDGRRDPPPAAGGQAAPPTGSASPSAPTMEATVALKNGDTLRGVVLKYAPPADIEFRSSNDAASATIRRIPLAEIVSVTIRPSGNPNKIASPQDLVGVLKTTLPPIDGSPELVIIKLSGEFTSDDIDLLGRSIAPGCFEAMMDVAVERKPAAIVLAIDSGGGYIWVMQNLIEQVMDLQRRQGIRMVAWPSKAGSAAAILSLACKEIVVTSTTRMGASIPILEGGEAAPEPSNAGEQKVAAWDEALSQLVFEFTGRNKLVQQAMGAAKPKLWYRQVRSEFRDSVPEGGDAAGWLALDEKEDRPLVLTGDQLRTIGFANPDVANDEASLLQSLKLPPETRIRQIDLNNPVVQEAARPLREEAAARLAKFRKVIRRKWEQFEKARSACYHAINIRNSFPPEGIAERHISALNAAVKKAQSEVPSLSETDKKLLTETAGPAWISTFEHHTTQARQRFDEVLKNLSFLKKLLREQHGGQMSNYPELWLALEEMYRAYGIQVDPPKDDSKN